MPYVWGGVMCGMEVDFADLMTEQVVIRPYTGRDGYGQPTYGDPITYQARVVGRMRRLTTFTGEDKVSTTTVLLLNSTGIDPRSLLTLPEGFVPASPPILAVLRDRDDTGALTETLYT